jgi:hypothetical protein
VKKYLLLISSFFAFVVFSTLTATSSYAVGLNGDCNPNPIGIAPITGCDATFDCDKATSKCVAKAPPGACDPNLAGSCPVGQMCNASHACVAKPVIKQGDGCTITPANPVPCGDPKLSCDPATNTCQPIALKEGAGCTITPGNPFPCGDPKLSCDPITNTCKPIALKEGAACTTTPGNPFPCGDPKLSCDPITKTCKSINAKLGDDCNGAAIASCGPANSGLVCDPATNKCKSSKSKEEPPPPPPPSPPCAQWNGGKCDSVGSAFGALSTAPDLFVKSIFSILLSLSGGLALLLIMRAGYSMMTSQGKPEQLNSARDQLIAAVVGLVFLILSFVILQVIGFDILQIPGFGA